ncbi:MAG TPA: uridine diphosphate-N-acetylglucosamine-binding protein YvcK [Candidatus Sulfotelmatobacter sp.]|nr:uridine diphosphate-N-acetylglucosamine-binding protein YvcK [Candidatus Sulfotelmatobacter sp.]
MTSPESRWGRYRRWLRPGMGLKRWLVAVFVGEALVAFAGALVLRQLYRDLAPDDPSQAPVLWWLTLQFLPLALRPVVLVGGGVAVFVLGLWGLMRAVLAPFQQRREPLVELIYQKRSLARGPRVVAIGGGTGLSTLLRGLKGTTSNITAVVAVADDGGSSGRLRTELGIAPVGDIRNCIAALADAEPVMTRLLQYRFPSSPSGSERVTGHAFGNLLIAALSDIEGDFEEGVRQSNRVLAVRGQVVPAAPVPLTLHAELADGSRVDGQSRIAAAHGIRRVWITPADVHATAEATEAIANADLVVLGPGSLYTSLLPDCLIPEIRNALLTTRAIRVLVGNVATQQGETEGFALSDHLRALEAHGILGAVDVVLANDTPQPRAPEGWPVVPVRVDLPTTPEARPRVILADVVDHRNGHYHDPDRLATALFALLEPGAVAAPAGVARTA